MHLFKSKEEKLLKKIENRDAIIEVIGLDESGLKLAIDFAENGFSVIAVDPDKKKIELLKGKESYSKNIDARTISKLIETESLIPSSEIKPADIFIVCIKPEIIDKEPFIVNIENSLKSISSFLIENNAVFIESELFIGTTEDRLKPILEKSGLVAGKEFYLAFVSANNFRIVGGIDELSGEICQHTYNTIGKAKKVSSIKTAEAIKIFENSLDGVGESFITEISMLFEKMGINVHEILLSTRKKYSPFDNSYYIPSYFNEQLRKTITDSSDFLKLSQKFQENLHYFIIKIAESTGSLNRTKVAVIGKESEIIKKVMQGLTEKGASVSLVNIGAKGFDAKIVKESEIAIVLSFSDELNNIFNARNLAYSELRAVVDATNMINSKIFSDLEIKYINITKTEGFFVRDEDLLKDERILNFFKAFIKGEIREIKPHLIETDRTFFSYPKINLIMNTTDEETIEILEKLADAGYLKRIFYDTILICPKCLGIASRMKGICPNCGSEEMGKTFKIHHYRCGYVGAVDDFTQGIKDESAKYVCPKCNKELRHIGIDYEKPGSINICKHCREKFEMPLEKFLCPTCEKSYLKNEVFEKNIYIYKENEEKMEFIKDNFLFITPIAEFLAEKKYTVKIFENVVGKSGLNYRFDILAEQEEKIAIKIFSEKDGVKLEKVLALKSMENDCEIKIILIANPFLKEDAKIFLEYFQTSYIEGNDKSTILKTLENILEKEKWTKEEKFQLGEGYVYLE